MVYRTGLTDAQTTRLGCAKRDQFFFPWDSVTDYLTPLTGRALQKNLETTNVG